MFKFAIAAVVGGACVAGLGAATGVVGAPHETQRGFPVHTIDSAPAASQGYLEWVNGIAGFVPHLSGVMAESPALAKSYWQLQMNLQELGSLSPAEDNIVQASIAFENECQYCVAGHTLAGQMYFEATPKEIAALRSDGNLPSAKQNALKQFALAVYSSKGRVSESELKAFYRAGYSRQQALEVVANIAAKVMTNYTNQIAMTPIDEPLKPLADGLPFQEDRELVTR